MNRDILGNQVQDFIRSYDKEVTQLAFKGSPYPTITTPFLIQQIEGFRKTKYKLPKWHLTPGVIFPAKLSLEQCSSESTATFKASLVSGNSIADLTGGFGVDCSYFAETFLEVYYYEQNKSLSEIASHNFKLFNQTSVICASGDSLEHIKDKTFSVIYVDPARRHQSKGKVFFLKDCEPNVVEHFDYIMDRCHELLIKTSPMLDISVGLSELQNVREIHVVAVKNEVKELLWMCSNKNFEGFPIIKTVNFKNDSIEELEFLYGQDIDESYAQPKAYLYEPNAAILKAGGFSEVCKQLNIDKLQKNSHLYTSDSIVKFPGRVFEIIEVIPYTKKDAKQKLSRKQANITVRNFPETVDKIRKKWNIRDGGPRYWFFTTLDNNEKVILDCIKLPKQLTLS